jgi:hypothetical protein
MLPEGLSDVELIHSKLPLDDILACKTALIRTALAYRDDQNRLKALMPISEYMHKFQPPQDYLIRPLLRYFYKFLVVFREQGTQMWSAIAEQISSNLANIQNVLRNGLQQGHPDLRDSISCALHLNTFSRLIGRGPIPLFDQLRNVLSHCSDHQLEAYFITELFGSWYYYSISNPETLVSQALEHFSQCNDLDLQCRFSV